MRENKRADIRRKLLGALGAIKEPGTLYWEEGVPLVSIDCYDGEVTKSAINEAVENLEAFRDKCQELVALFDVIIGGKTLWLDRIRPHLDLEQYPNSRHFFGTQFPDEPQSRGQSTTSWLYVKRLLELLKPGGEGENLVANLFVISLYHLWEDEYRKIITQSLNVEQERVVCYLMGEIRFIRNDIVHNHTVVKKNTVDKVKMLQQIWSIKAGKLLVTQSMLHALMEQINAIKVIVEPKIDITVIEITPENETADC